MEDTSLELLIEGRTAFPSGRGERLRRAAGLNKSDMARLVGVTPAALSRWESGVRTPSGESAVAWIGDPIKDAGYVLLESRYAVPRRFHAAAWPVERHRVHMAIEIDDTGAPSCRELKLEPLDEGGHVAAAVLRAVAVDKLMRLAVAEAMRVGDLQADDEPPERTTSADRDAFYERYRRGARRPQRGSPLTDENLQRVADVYRAAMQRGDPPTETVSEQLNVARSTAGRWVAAARKRGLLGPAVKGKGGEQ